MKKVVLLFLAIITISYGSQRVVVAEQFTATWCPYCPGAARAHYEIYHRTYDSLVVIAYHPSGTDPFYSAEAASRASYYNIPGYPTSWFDGVIESVGGQRYGNNYPRFRTSFDQRINISSPLEIFLDCAYDTVADSGMVTATVENTSGASVNGNLHFVIVENDIPYNWMGMNTLEFLMRDMLPDAAGESVSIPVSDTIIRSRDFAIDATWNELNCRIVVFVQATSKEIYQGTEIALIEEPHMEYYGASVSETSGNGNGVVEPGESMEMRVSAKNLGDGVYANGVSINTSDPHISITSSYPHTVSIRRGDVDTVITFSCDIDVGCPDPHSVVFELDFGSTIDTIPFVFTTRPGFSDDIESGEGDWTHAGMFDQWHITEHSSYSPTHSWYNGYENVWSYPDQSDVSLITPYFVVPPDSTLYFYQQYNMETNYDYGYVEIDDGSGWWRTFERFTGISGWTEASYPLTEYDGQTVRIRFRFLSDYDMHTEGWYVDDVQVPTEIGIAEHISPPTVEMPLLTVLPNPFRKKTDISFGIEHGAKSVELKIYNVVGRLVKQWNHPTIQASNHILWDGTDQRGIGVPDGIYFIRLNIGTTEIIESVVLLR